jgi:hypothetical protein
MNLAEKAAFVSGEQDLPAFFNRNRRLPRLGDDPPPWAYRGWLLPYVIQLHALLPSVADRWGYHLRTLEAGKLLEEPIPQIRFGPADETVFSLLHDWSRLVGHDCGSWGDFRILLDWLSWGLALCKEAPLLSDKVNEGLYRQVNLGPLLATPHDYLGEYVARGKAWGWNPTAFFPTPHPVVECMVRMTMDHPGEDCGDPRARSVADPSVGSGRMLLHSSNSSLSLFGQDIDPLAVAMCKINGALYAPWMSFPLPSSVLGAQAETPPPSSPAPDGERNFREEDRGQGLLFDL